MMIRNLLIISVICFLSFIFFINKLEAFNLGVVERTFQGSSNLKSLAEAKKDIQNQAIEKNSRELIIEMVGQENYAKNLEKIKEKIINQSEKYIHYLKLSNVQKTAKGNIYMHVNMKISLDNLKTLLLAQGFMYQSDKMPVIFPMIDFEDRINFNSFKWWNLSQLKDVKSIEAKLLVNKYESFLDKLKKRFWEKGFFVLQPKKIGLANLVETNHKLDNLSTESCIKLADKFSAQIILRGKIIIEKNILDFDEIKIKVNLEALQVVNNRSIAFVTKNFKTQSDNFEKVMNNYWEEKVDAIISNLKKQIVKIWEKGIFGSSLAQVKLIGANSYKEYSQFKQILGKNFRYIKEVTEELLSNNLIIYKISFMGELQKIKEIIENSQIDSRNLIARIENSHTIMVKIE